MKITLKRLFALAISFALGLMAATTAFAQDNQIERIERSIAQLQAELAAIKNENRQSAFQDNRFQNVDQFVPQSFDPNPIAPGSIQSGSTINENGWLESSDGPAIIEPILADSYQATELPVSERQSLLYPQSTQNDPRIEQYAPPVSRSPGIVGQPVLTRPAVIEQTFIQPQPRVLVQQPIVVTNRAVRYCPVRGRYYDSTLYRETTTRYRASSNWDYFDEDRVGGRANPSDFRRRDYYRY